MKQSNFKSAKISYSNAVKMNKCEDQWYKKFGSFLIGIVNGRKDFLHSCGVVGLSLVLVSNASFVQAEPAINALPTGYQSVAGNIEFNQTANTLNVLTGANNSIANYQSFNVGQNATVNFNLPSSQSAILNRVTGGIGSEIFGSINSNGKVFLVNPSGILFGSTAQVNVGSLVTSTLNINNQDFLNKNYNFTQSGNTPAGIVNNGSLVAHDGSVVLLGGAIQNTGNIQASNGSIQMAVGKSATITMEDGVNVDIQINEALEDKVNGVQSAISNSGSLSANVIKAQASLNNAIYDQAINNSGLIQAQGVINNGGVIELIGQKGIVENTGSLIANNENGKGGNIRLIGEETYILNGSQIEANGKTGGGEILIGGDYLGKGTEHNSKNTFVDKQVEIKANAIENGNGGKVIVWADGNTIFNGKIEAKGGNESGNGGFVETSGKENLAIGSNVSVQTSALNGEFGTWLLDPMNITIQAGGSTDPLLLTVMNSPFDFGNYTIDPTLLTGQASDVVLVATNNIINNSTLNFASGQDFTVLAGNNFTSAIGTSISTTNANITIGASGSLNLNNTNLTANNGDIVLVSGARLPFPLPSAPAGGSITGTGILSGNSLLAASMTGGMVDLINVANNFTNLTAYTPNGGNFQYQDANSINLKTYTVTPAIAVQIAVFGLPSIYTNNIGAGTQNITAAGDITVNSVITKVSGVADGQLSLQAGNNVRINNTGSINSTSGKLDVVLMGNLGNTTTGQGDVRVDGAINTNGGDVRIYGRSETGSLSGVAILDPINTAGGLINIEGASNASGASGIEFTSTGDMNSTGGNITLTGNTANTTNHGIDLTTGSLISSGAGTLSLTGNNTHITGAGLGINLETGAGLQANNKTITLSSTVSSGDAIRVNGTVNAGTGTGSQVIVNSTSLGADFKGNGSITAKDLTVNMGTGRFRGNTPAALFETTVDTLTANSNNGAVRINNTKTITVNASDVGSRALEIQAAGNINQAGAVKANGLTLKTTGAGFIDFDNIPNQIQSIDFQTEGGSATFADINGVIINKADLDTLGTGTAGDLTIVAGDGAVSQSGLVGATSTIKANTLTVSVTNSVSNTGSINLNQVSSNNDVNKVSFTTQGGNASYKDINGFDVANTNVQAGDLTLIAGGAGNITQNTGTIQGTTLSLQTASGTANLNNVGNNFANLTSTSTSGTISYTDANTIKLQASNVGSGTLKVKSVLGDINQSGVLLGKDLLVNAGGSVNLGGTANDFNNLGILAVVGSASYQDADAININSASGAGTILSITAGNAPNPNSQDTATNGLTLSANITAPTVNLTVSGGTGGIDQNTGTTIQGVNLNLVTDGGTATINDADFTNLTANTNNGNAKYLNKRNMVFCADGI